MRAHWNGTVLAESDSTVVVEGNHYFPPDSVRWDELVPSDHRTTCVWKGRAHYWSVANEEGADEQDGRDVAWSYPEPLPPARKITDHVAFWRGVVVEE